MVSEILKEKEQYILEIEKKLDLLEFDISTKTIEKIKEFGMEVSDHKGNLGFLIKLDRGLVVYYPDVNSIKDMEL